MTIAKARLSGSAALCAVAPPGRLLQRLYRLGLAAVASEPGLPPGDLESELSEAVKRGARRALRLSRRQYGQYR